MTPTHVFFVKYCKTFRNSFFIKHFRWLLLCKMSLKYSIILHLTEAYSEACQTSKIKRVPKAINHFAKHFLLDVWQGSEYTPVYVAYLFTIYLDTENCCTLRYRPESGCLDVWRSYALMISIEFSFHFGFLFDTVASL